MYTHFEDEIQDSFIPDPMGMNYENIARRRFKKQQELKRQRLIEVIGLMLICSLTVGFFALSQYFKNKPSDQSQSPLMPELEARRNWFHEYLLFDPKPIPTEFGYLQKLMMAYGSDIRKELIKQQNTKGHPCNQFSETIETCAARAVITNDYKEFYPALNGEKYYLAKKDSKGNLYIVRQLHQTEMLADGVFRKGAFEEANYDTVFSPSIDPWNLDNLEELTIRARANRLSEQGHTDGAAITRALEAGLKGYEAKIKEKR